MKHDAKLDDLIKRQRGTVLSADLDALGIPRSYLKARVDAGQMERVRSGVYVAADSIEDDMYAVQRKFPKLIYSHETALFLHDLTDRTPFIYSATVPSGYKVTDTVSKKSKIFYVRMPLHKMGVMTCSSSHGNPIQVYDIERTVCDLIRSRSRIDFQILQDALKRFIALNTADYSRLLAYARKLRVESIVRHYMEVLL